MRTPRLVIAAPASGCGKTTVAIGLMAALRAAGAEVSAHKVGPDYIDPGYHALACGRPGRNLDPFLCGEELILPLFAHGAAGADIAVIEGVMGLFDGVTDAAAAGLSPDYASTAHVARLLRAPVVLVVDAAAAGRSVAATVAGFAGFDRRVRVAGVIFNRVGSDRHERLLGDAVGSLGIRVFGAIRRTDAVVTPSRHLGLVPVAERHAAAQQAIGRLADLVASSCDLSGLRALATSAPPLTVQPWEPGAAIAGSLRLTSAGAPKSSVAPASPGTYGGRSPGRGAPVIAVAEGSAFTFSYAEHAELLRAAGACLAPFDPLADEALPPQTSGLVIGGGFPEMYAPDLSANASLRQQVTALVANGAPVVAECAGLLYLARALDGLPMCGAISVDAHMTGQLTLGYRTGAAASDSVLAHQGDQVRGHEFHRTAVKPICGSRPAWRLADPAVHGGAGARAEGHVSGHMIASYLHLHWARTPSFAARFRAACAAGGASGPAHRAAAGATIGGAGS